MTVQTSNGVHNNAQGKQKVDFNKVVTDYQNGVTDFSEFYQHFYAEKKRFMSQAPGMPEIEAVFDDTLLAVLKEWQDGNSFIGLLRLRLDSRLTDFFRAEAKQKMYERKSVEQYSQFTRNPMLVKQHEVEFFSYLETLDPQLHTAAQMLLNDYTMNEAAKAVGIRDMRTLKSRLQKAFAQFLDR